MIAYVWNLYLNWQGLVSHARVGGGAALMFILVAFVVFGLSLLVLVLLLIKAGFGFRSLPAPRHLSSYTKYLASTAQQNQTGAPGRARLGNDCQHIRCMRAIFQPAIDRFF